MFLLQHTTPKYIVVKKAVAGTYNEEVRMVSGVQVTLHTPVSTYAFGSVDTAILDPCD